MSGGTDTKPDKRTVYYARDIHQINLVLGKFAQKSGANTVMLVDEAGHLIARQGAVNPASDDTVTALVAGTCAASRALAEMLGTQEFSSLIPCGAGRYVMLLRVSDTMLLAVSFGEDSSVPLVRTFALEVIRRLEAILHAQAEARRDGSEAIHGQTFDNEIGGALNDVFG